MSGRLLRRAARLATVMAALGAGCGSGTAAPPASGGPVDFTIGGLAIHFSSGAAAVVGGVLTLYLIDLPAACATLTNVSTGNPPLGKLTTLAVRVVADSSGNTGATVVAPTPVPPPGHAAGSLVQKLSGAVSATFDLADGTVAWTTDSSGNVTLVSVDVGFAGTTDRLVSRGLYLPACRL